MKTVSRLCTALLGVLFLSGSALAAQQDAPHPATDKPAQGVQQQRPHKGQAPQMHEQKGQRPATDKPAQGVQQQRPHKGQAPQMHEQKGQQHKGAAQTPRHQQTTGKGLHGNPKSKIYHTPQCQYYNSKEVNVPFGSPQEAQKQGYRPCKKCGG